jgi:hypothetical protein
MEHVISTDNWRKIFLAMEKRVPLTCKHLIVNMGIPVVWPSMEVAELFLNSLGLGECRTSLKSIIDKNSLFSSFFPNSELIKKPNAIYDLSDRWNSSSHQKERKFFIEAFQGFSESRNIRVTFICGDTHCCGIGRIYSDKGYMSQPQFDHRLMYSITSSAIMNNPPPKALIYFYHLSESISNFCNNHFRDGDEGSLNEAYHTGKIFLELINFPDSDKIEKISSVGRDMKTLWPIIKSLSKYVPLGHSTHEEMLNLFDDSMFDMCKKILPVRNWCDVKSEGNSMVVMAFKIN